MIISIASLKSGGRVVGKQHVLAMHGKRLGGKSRVGLVLLLFCSNPSIDFAYCICLCS